MKIQNIVISEPKNFEDFYPFSIMHSVWEIRVGVYEIWEKITLEIPNTNLLFDGRQDHLDSFFQRKELSNETLYKGLTLVIGANVLPDDNFFKDLSKAIVNYPDKSIRLTAGGKPIGGIFSEVNWVENLEIGDISNYQSGMWSNFAEIELGNTKVINYLWETLDYNGSEITKEVKFFKSYNRTESANYTGVYFLKRENVHIAERVVIMPGVVINASAGPVILSEGVRIMPHSIITGPCFIGKNTTIKAGAKIYQDVSIGEQCKIGGEVEGSIIHGFSNKQHDGFLGHSYIGEWVNIGAGTNNSDLKNTYEEIKIQLEDNDIETGRKFIGWMCGDHSKTAINTKVNTSSIMGIAQIIACDGFPPKFLPSFSWGGKANSPIYKIDKAIKTAKAVMERRGKEMLEIEEKLFKAEHERVNK